MHFTRLSGEYVVYFVIWLYDKNDGWERRGVPRSEEVLPYVGDYPILFIFSLPLLLHVIQ